MIKGLADYYKNYIPILLKAHKHQSFEWMPYKYPLVMKKSQNSFLES